MSTCYSFTLPKETIESYFNKIDIIGTIPRKPLIRAKDTGYVITNKHQDRLQKFTWGFVPQSAKNLKNLGKLINARSEGLETQPSYRMALRQKRCLVLADSFFIVDPITDQIVYKVQYKDKNPIIMAGLWDEWSGSDGRLLRTYTVITTTANDDIKGLTSRMPAILENQDKQDQWLNNNGIFDLLPLLTTTQNGVLSIDPI